MYYVVYGICWLISLLPFPILYLISDAFYVLGFYILKYRRDVVMHNLLIAFPDKTEKERTAIAKKFYHNLIDMFIETIKMLSISVRSLEKRFKGNWELLNGIYPTGKSVQVHVGHNFNWEWGNTVMTKNTPFKLLAVYMPFTNNVIEKLFYKLRTRHGAIFLRATRIKEDILPHKKTQYVLGLVADQNPGRPDHAWWFNFFDRPTPFSKGPARAAIENDTAVLFAFIHKPRRGYYEAVLSQEVKDPKSLTEQELTRKFVVYLEDVIRKHPEMWLWSHRRWKHDWKEEYGEVLR